MNIRNLWLGTAFATVFGQGWVDSQGYAPGTCTDQLVAPPSVQGELKPCAPAQSSQSIRSRRTYRSHGGK